ncbi:hypothetical protein C8R42DRAFT_724395 [Lentinula raphanica]|nr:hypothetical protein C8R42DRAFT_724395 [Lentinula raphanica]
MLYTFVHYHHPLPTLRQDQPYDTDHEELCHAPPPPSSRPLLLLPQTTALLHNPKDGSTPVPPPPHTPHRHDRLYKAKLYPRLLPCSILPFPPLGLFNIIEGVYSTSVDELVSVNQHSRPAELYTTENGNKARVERELCVSRVHQTNSNDIPNRAFYPLLISMSSPSSSFPRFTPRNPFVKLDRTKLNRNPVFSRVNKAISLVTSGIQHTSNVPLLEIPFLHPLPPPLSPTPSPTSGTRKRFLKADRVMSNSNPLFLSLSQQDLFKTSQSSDNFWVDIFRSSVGSKAFLVSRTILVLQTPTPTAAERSNNPLQPTDTPPLHSNRR